MAPSCLQALGLDADADERAVRRAYAKRLKQIDQETQAAAFQALRGHFEQALAWVAAEARRRASDADEDEDDEPGAREPLRFAKAMPLRRHDALPPQPEPEPEPAPPAPAPEAPPRPAPDNAARLARLIGDPLARSARDEAPPAGLAPAPSGEPLRALRSPAAAPQPSGPAPALLRQFDPRSAPPPALGSDAVPVPAPLQALSRGRAPAAPPAPAGPPPLRPAPPVAPATDPRRPDTAPPLPPRASSAEDRLDAEAIADAVFKTFMTLAARELRNPAAMKRALRIALDDPRLVNLDARGYFEARVAGRLADGWHPGHELIFDAANEQFGWQDDRRRLQAFGPLGAFIDSAVRERLVLWRQPEARMAAEDRLIRRLRLGPPQDEAELLALMPQLQAMLEHYPNWLRVATSREHVQEWLRRWQALPQSVREPMTLVPAAPVPPPPTPVPRRAAAPAPAARPPASGASSWLRSSGRWGTGAWVMIGILVAVINGFTHGSRTPSHAQSLPEPMAQPAAEVPATQAPGSDLLTRQREAEASLRRALATTPDAPALR